MPKRVQRLLWVIGAMLLGAVFLYRGDLTNLAHLSDRTDELNFSATGPSNQAVFATHFSTSTFYRVVHVVDGDTIDIDADGERVRVRLIGINAPEAAGPQKPMECFGKEALRRMEQMLSGQLVRVEIDPTQGRLDKYGRTLVYVYLSDGTSFNKKMIAEGYAHEYTYRYPYKYQKEFKQSEQSARERGIGLWASEMCGMR
ncbi:MAG: thermonuclease family protein [bacterium]|nr:thermonuclease family protein [bacterium]